MELDDISILSLIDSGDWSSALFTTFTLSLTYLESHVLPRLRKRGCQRLTVLSDVAGYRDSLMEQRARAVGRDYSVVPVHVKGGILHAKLVHLRAHDGDVDLVLVGSGNLTYPGHGGNVEVLEALRPDRHATAFGQVADFFELLVSTPRISVADPAAVMASVTRLREVASRGANTEDVRFIHSIERSGLDQLLEAARARDEKWEELLVLSPYHHPSAQPVRRILTGLDIERLTVGVSAKQREGSAFPFDEARKLGLSKLISVAPVSQKADRRNLHAKWLELRRPGGALALTGSFNATAESLETTHNVECGVLRHFSEPTTAPWHEVAEPRYVRGEFPNRDGGALSYCLFAAFNEASLISGNLLGASATTAGPWQALLETAEQVLGTEVVTVAEDGAFKWKGAWKVDEVTAGTLQLTLTREGMEARGWVQVNRVLNMRASERSLMQALAQMNARTHSDDDMGTVLDYIASNAALLMAATPSATPSGPGTGASGTEGGAGAPTVERTLSPEQFEALQDTQGVPNQYDSGLMLNAIYSGHHGWDILRHVCAALMALPKYQAAKVSGVGSWNWSPAAASGGTPDDGDPPKKGPDTRETQLAATYKALQHQLQIAELATSKSLTPGQRIAAEVGKSRLLLMWSWVELRFRLMEMGQVEAAQEFLWTWLRQVCDLRLPANLKTHLDQQVCGVAAAYALCLLERPRRPGDLSTSPEQVHRLLDRYFAGPVPLSARTDARAWLETEPGRQLTLGRTDDALDSLDMVLDERTERQTLRAIMSGRPGDPQESETQLLSEKRVQALFQDNDIRTLKRLLKAKALGHMDYFLVDRHTLTSCPGCGLDFLMRRSVNGASVAPELDSEVSRRLKQYAMTECRSCKKVLLALEP